MHATCKVDQELLDIAVVAVFAARLLFDYVGQTSTWKKTFYTYESDFRKIHVDVAGQQFRAVVEIDMDFTPLERAGRLLERDTYGAHVRGHVIVSEKVTSRRAVKRGRLLVQTILPCLHMAENMRLLEAQLTVDCYRLSARALFETWGRILKIADVEVREVILEKTLRAQVVTTGGRTLQLRYHCTSCR